MSRSLDDLSPVFRPLADQVLAHFAAIGKPLVVTYTLRSQADQDSAVSQGRSQLHHGPHLAHADGGSWAMDVCPESLIHLPNYAPADPVWWELGAFVVSLGLRWGGQWSRPAPPPVGHPPKTYLWDPGHVEYQVVSPQSSVIS